MPWRSKWLGRGQRSHEIPVRGTDGIKGRGRRWDLPNAVGVVSMEALYQGNLWDSYWKAQTAALN